MDNLVPCRKFYGKEVEKFSRGAEPSPSLGKDSAVAAPAKLTLTARDAKVPFDVTPTGGKRAWKTIGVGTLDLPAGEATVQLKPVGKDWAGGPNLRRLWLTLVPK